MELAKTGQDGYIYYSGVSLIKFDLGRIKDEKNPNEVIQNYRRNRDYWITPENLAKFKDPHGFNMEKWMHEAGLEYNQKNLEDVCNTFHRCMNRMWMNAIQTLLDCAQFKAHRNGDTYETFKESFLGDHNLAIRFQDGFSPEDEAQLDKGHILIHL